MAVVDKQAVRDYWEAKPCGSPHGESSEGTAEWFAEIEARRYEDEPFIGRYARWEETEGLSVLEIGVGLGTDFVRFARAGARATGVDLTQRGVEMVRRRLTLEGLSAEVQVADAEQLPFPDGSFDVVYSWGVLHHTPDTEKAMAEAIRVVKPSGRVTVMVYARRSWIALALWAQYELRRGRPWRTLARAVADNMESDGTRSFTASELRAIFGDLDDLRIVRVATRHEPRLIALARFTRSRFGWFLVVSGRRPAATA
jgi:SAM-dependent methyltransferase